MAQRKPAITRDCTTCGVTFRTTIAKRMLCNECRTAERNAAASLFSSTEVACGRCAHAYRCKEAHSGFACGLEAVSRCKPYTQRILYKEGTPRPARSPKG